MKTIPPVLCIAEKPSQQRSYLAAFKHEMINDNGCRYGYVLPCEAAPAGMLIFSAIGHLMELINPEDYPGKEHLKNWDLATIPFGLPQQLEYRPKRVMKMIGRKQVEDNAATADIKRMLDIMKGIIQQAIAKYGVENVTFIHGTDQDFEGSAISHEILKYCITDDQYTRINHNRLWINSLEPEAVWKGFMKLKDREQASKDGQRDIHRARSAMTRAHNDFICGLSCTRINTILINQLLVYIHNLQNTGSGQGVASINAEHVLPPLRDIVGPNTTYNTGRIISAITYMVYKRDKEIAEFVEQPFYELYADFAAQQGRYRGKAKFKSFNLAETDAYLSSFGLQDGAKVQGEITNVEVKEVRSDAPMLHSLTTIQAFANAKYKLSAASTLKICQSLYETHKIITYPRTDSQYLTELEFNYLYNNLEQYKTVFDMPFETAYHKPRKRYINSQKVAEHYALTLTKSVPTKEKLASLSKDERNIYYEIVRTTLGMFAPDYVYEKTTITTNVKGLEFFTSGKVEKSPGFKLLWGQESEEDLAARGKSKKQKEEEEEFQGALPAVQQGEPVHGVIERKQGLTSPPKYYTEGTLLKAMETCGQDVEDEEEAAILKEIGGIGTVATRAEAINKIKFCNYVEVIKNKLMITPKGRIKALFVEGSMFSDVTTTAKWEKYLRGIAEGVLPVEPFKKRTDQFVENYLQKSLAKINDDQFFDAVTAIIRESAAEQEAVRITCPKCKSGAIVLVEGKESNFYACTNYREQVEPCKFTLPGVYCGKKITATMVKQLCTKGRTNSLKLISAKKKVEYKAYLALDEQFKIQQEFVNHSTKKNTTKRKK